MGSTSRVKTLGGGVYVGLSELLEGMFFLSLKVVCWGLFSCEGFRCNGMVTRNAGIYFKTKGFVLMEISHERQKESDAKMF